MYRVFPDPLRDTAVHPRAHGSWKAHVVGCLSTVCLGAHRWSWKRGKSLSYFVAYLSLPMATGA